MSNPNPIHKDIKKTIDDLLLSLPFKKGDLVRTFYTNPPSTRKIEELQICSAFPSGVRVQLENVKSMFLNYFLLHPQLIIANTQIMDELVFWRKDYIANN